MYKSKATSTTGLKGGEKKRQGDTFREVWAWGAGISSTFWLW